MDLHGFNFTERCRRVLMFARDEAGSHGHRYVSPDHMLLGLIADGEGVGAYILSILAGDLETLRVEVDALLPGPEGGSGAPPDLPYSARAKRVLELSMASARDLDHPYVGSEHLLLGLLEGGQLLSMSTLAGRGVTKERARDEIIRVLTTEPVESSEEPAVDRAEITLHLRSGKTVSKSCTNLHEAVTFLKLNRLR